MRYICHFSQALLYGMVHRSHVTCSTGHVTDKWVSLWQNELSKDSHANRITQLFQLARSEILTSFKYKTQMLTCCFHCNSTFNFIIFFISHSVRGGGGTFQPNFVWVHLFTFLSQNLKGKKKKGKHLLKQCMGLPKRLWILNLDWGRGAYLDHIYIYIFFDGWGMLIFYKIIWWGNDFGMTSSNLWRVHNYKSIYYKSIVTYYEYYMNNNL